MIKAEFSSTWILPALGFFFLFLLMSETKVAYADKLVPITDQQTCITCHENLYFLHDTGNWYCLRESPMSCVDCHGGNPAATAQEQAHLDRAAHPVTNDDTSKCQQCHPEECAERVKFFDQAAGINQVRVAAPQTLDDSREERAPGGIGVTKQQRESGNQFLYLELIPVVLLAGFALTVCLISRHISKEATKGNDTN
jgi:hypothetical protein